MKLTYDELNLGFWLLLVAFVATTLVGAFVQHQRDEARSLLAEKYNFTEDECVAGRVLVPLYDSKTGEDIGTQWNGYCTLYCHTAQIPDGEECRTIQTVRVSEWCGRVFNWMNNETLDEGCSNEYFSLWFNMIRPALRYYKQSVSSVGVDEWFIELPSNQTTCTPRYRTVNTICMTADEIAKVREVLG